MKIKVIWKDGKIATADVEGMRDIDHVHSILEKRKFFKATDEDGNVGLLNTSDISLIIEMEQGGEV